MERIRRKIGSAIDYLLGSLGEDISIKGDDTRPVITIFDKSGKYVIDPVRGNSIERVNQPEMDGNPTIYVPKVKP